MKRRTRGLIWVATVLGFGVSWAQSTVAQSQADTARSPTQTPWGHPDLQGTWSSDDMRRMPLQRPDSCV